MTLFFATTFQPRREKLITPPNCYPPFFWVYVLWHKGLACLHSCWEYLLFFLLLQVFCQLAEIKTPHSGEGGYSPTAVSCDHWESQARWGSFRPVALNPGPEVCSLGAGLLMPGTRQVSVSPPSRIQGHVRPSNNSGLRLTLTKTIAQDLKGKKSLGQRCFL